jgi:hypothetical protein
LAIEVSEEFYSHKSNEMKKMMRVIRLKRVSFQLPVRQCCWKLGEWTLSIVKSGALLALLVTATTLPACNKTNKEEGSKIAMDQINANEWQAVTQKRIIFGHQSVGNNILSGIKSLADQAGVNLKIIESRSAATELGITHFKIGRNEDPQSKLKDFMDTLKSGTAQGADIAFMKLCYVDINSSTDVKKLADEYRSSLDSLSTQFPHTVFIAVTSPLTTLQSGPKAWIKRLMGREPNGYSENFRRQEFNNILRSIYGRQGRLFDLAKLEAEGAGFQQYQGQPLEVLNSAMSNDGGHLNAIGAQFVAAKLVRFIATISSNP